MIYDGVPCPVRSESAASISGPADRFNQTAMGAQLSPQRHDMVVNGPVGNRVVVTLNGRNDLFSGENLSVALHQEEQESGIRFSSIPAAGLPETPRLSKDRESVQRFELCFLLSSMTICSMTCDVASVATRLPPKSNRVIGPTLGRRSCGNTTCTERKVVERLCPLRLLRKRRLALAGAGSPRRCRLFF